MATLSEQEKRRQQSLKAFDYAENPIKEWIAKVMGKEPQELFDTYNDECELISVEVDGNYYLAYLTIYPNKLVPITKRIVDTDAMMQIQKANNYDPAVQVQPLHRDVDSHTAYILPPAPQEHDSTTKKSEYLKLYRAATVLYEAVLQVYPFIVKTINNKSANREVVVEDPYKKLDENKETTTNNDTTNTTNDTNNNTTNNDTTNTLPETKVNPPLIATAKDFDDVMPIFDPTDRTFTFRMINRYHYLRQQASNQVLESTRQISRIQAGLKDPRTNPNNIAELEKNLDKLIKLRSEAMQKHNSTTPDIINAQQEVCQAWNDAFSEKYKLFVVLETGVVTNEQNIMKRLPTFGEQFTEPDDEDLVTKLKKEMNVRD